MILRGRMGAMATVFVALLALASGKPAWGKNGNNNSNKKPSGDNAIADGTIDFDALSPKDCAAYLCVTSTTLAEDYIESGCPGQFAHYEPEHNIEVAPTNLMESTTSSSSDVGVTTGTLLALAGASGVFAAGVGFFVGYKASPSFAYMRIPSLV